jgi:hypothetical protein
LGNAVDGQGFRDGDAAGDDMAIRILKWLGVDAGGGEEKQRAGSHRAEQAAEEGAPHESKEPEEWLRQVIHFRESTRSTIGRGKLRTVVCVMIILLIEARASRKKKSGLQNHGRPIHFLSYIAHV